VSAAVPYNAGLAALLDASSLPGLGGGTNRLDGFVVGFEKGLSGCIISRMSPPLPELTVIWGGRRGPNEEPSPDMLRSCCLDSGRGFRKVAVEECGKEAKQVRELLVQFVEHL
jgi:hypothetical protein